MPDPERPRLPLWFVLVVGALALFGLVAMIQWVLGAIFGLIRLALVIAVVGGVAALLIGRVGRRTADG